MVDGQGNNFKTNLVVPTIFEEKSGKTFKYVSCGKDHVAAITEDGKIISMGNPSHGKLGFKLPEEDRTKNGYSPTAINNRSLIGEVDLEDIKQVSCGFRHTAAINSKGDLYTWGEGKHGQLGQSSFDNTDVPKKLDLTIKVEKVECGASHTIILDDKGKLFAFGNNRYGQLGITGLDNVVLNHPAGI